MPPNNGTITHFKWSVYLLFDSLTTKFLPWNELSWFLSKWKESFSTQVLVHYAVMAPIFFAWGQTIVLNINYKYIYTIGVKKTLSLLYLLGSSMCDYTIIYWIPIHVVISPIYHK